MQSAVLKKILKTFAPVLFVLPALSSADASARPAQFGAALSVLSANVPLPDSFDGGFKAVSVYCQSDIAVSGNLDNIQCYQHPKMANLEAQTVAALSKATFTPAQVDGQTVPVRMQFRVVYSRSGDQPDIVLLPNLGTLQSQYGYDYFAPQERLDQQPWYQRYSKNDWAKGQAFFDDGRLTRVMGTVSADGKVGDVTTLDARGSGKRDASVIEDALKQSRFVPGFVKDQATEMHYVAVLNYSR